MVDFLMVNLFKKEISISNKQLLIVKKDQILIFTQYFKKFIKDP